MSIEGVYDSGTLYGTEKTLQIPVYISDGEYIAKVRVQNQFGLWSQWGSCPLTVENNEGGAITLSAADSAGIAVLTWQTADTFDSFIVYRNGKEIAVTENSFFEDNFAAGLNEYQIRGVKAGGNYYLSGTQEVNIKISQAMITLTSMVDWVKLYYSTKILQEVSSNESTTVHLLNIYGTDYPFAEVSTAKRGNLNLSFGLPADDKTTLEKVRAMIGKEACVKVTSGDVIFGIIESMSITKNKFITSCNCQIRRTAGEKQW